MEEGERSGSPLPFDPEEIKRKARERAAGRLCQALEVGLASVDVDEYDIKKVVRRLKKWSV